MSFPTYPEVQVSPIFRPWLWEAHTEVVDAERSDWRRTYWRHFGAVGFSRAHALRRVDRKVSLYLRHVEDTSVVNVEKESDDA